jgi:hypothetical protein
MGAWLNGRAAEAQRTPAFVGQSLVFVEKFTGVYDEQLRDRLAAELSKLAPGIRSVIGRFHLTFIRTSNPCPLMREPAFAPDGQLI